METCYRHPDRETGVSCSLCGRPICPECMTPTPVGMRCPECSRQRTRVTVGPPGTGGGAPATRALIAANALVFLAQIATGGGGIGDVNSSLVRDLGLQGAAVADGEWYRLLTGGFLHSSLIHIGFNMVALYFIGGRLLEPAIGTVRFLALYFASLLAGSFGAVALTDPLQITVGASGAVFGTFGAAFLIARRRGDTAIASELGLLLAINFALTFALPRISVGGHLGGLIGGVVCALVIVAGERGTLGRRPVATEVALMAVVGLVCAAGAIAVA